MKPDQARQFLVESLAELAQARRHLDYSFQQVAGLPDDLSGADAGQLESVEAFSSRFARTVDLLVNKTLRSLDRMELLAQGTLLDVSAGVQKGISARVQKGTEFRVSILRGFRASC